MPRAFNLLLEDVLGACDKIGRYTKGLAQEDFLSNELTVDAVIRNLEIIGEAVGNFDYAVKLAHPNVDWQKIIGMRNILVHHYFHINASVVWQVVETQLQLLREEIILIQKELPN